MGWRGRRERLIEIARLLGSFTIAPLFVFILFGLNFVRFAVDPSSS